MQRTPMLARAFVVLAILAAPSAVAWAQAKTDVVTLANGDRITGEILHVNRGRLDLSTDDAGTISIEWVKVAAVESTNQFEVETSGGRRLLGSLERAGDGTVHIVGGDGAIVSLAIAEVTRITPIGASFWAKLEGSVDFGFSYTKASGVAQTTLNTNTMFRRPAFTVQLTSSATVTHQDDTTGRDDRSVVAFSYVRFRGRRWFLSGSGGVENNESLGLVLRSQVAGLAGQRFVNTNRAQVAAGGGLVFNNEQGVDTEATQNVEGLLVFAASYYTYDRPKTNVDTTFKYYPGLSDWGRQRVQMDASFKRELFKDFFVAANVYYSFDSAPPNPTAARHDVGVTTSIGWSFGPG